MAKVYPINKEQINHVQKGTSSQTHWFDEQQGHSSDDDIKLAKCFCIILDCLSDVSHIV